MADAPAPLAPYRPLTTAVVPQTPGPIDAELRPSSSRAPTSMWLSSSVAAAGTAIMLGLFYAPSWAFLVGLCLAPLLVAKSLDRLVFAPRAARQFNAALTPLLEQLGRGHLDQAEAGFRKIFTRSAGRGGLQAIALFNIAATRARRGDPLGALRILLELASFGPTKRAANVANILPLTIAAHWAQLGDTEEARRWLTIGRTQSRIKLYSGNIEAVILMREGKWADAEVAYEREWPDLERLLPAADLRGVAARRAFALEQSGAPAERVQRFVEIARPSRERELDHVGVEWGELRAFLEKHRLAGGRVIDETERTWPLRPVNDAKLAVVYQQLAVMLESGVAASEALRLLLRHARGRLGRALAAVEAALKTGATLGDAFAQDPVVFPASVRMFIVAGEASGGLPAVFADLATSIELRLQLRRRMIRACVYPFILFTLSFFLLPLEKLVSHGVGAYLRASLLRWVEACGLVATAFIAVPWGVRALLGPRRVSWLVRRVPLVGGLYRARARAAFARHLASALRAGLDAFSSLSLAAHATGDRDFEEKIAAAATRVRGGATLEEGLSRSLLFDEDFLLAVAGGERAGRLDTTLEQQGRLLTEWAIHRIEILVQLAAMFVLLGVYAYVGWSLYREYQHVIAGSQEQIDQLMKQIDVGGSLGGQNGSTDTLNLGPDFQ